MNTDGQDIFRNTPRDIPAHADPIHRQISFDRIRSLISELELELARADIPQAQNLRTEIDRLKQILASPEGTEEGVRDQLHGVHNTFQDVTATVEGEVLRDSPYIAEIGRILGLV